MLKSLVTLTILCFFLNHTEAQIGAMKLVGPDTENYKLGFGAFIKAGVPVTNKGDATLEVGFNYFPSKDEAQGALMCPLKAGYRYLFSPKRKGFYVEPQIGYNLYGITSVLDDDGYNVDLKYNGVVFAAGTGYLIVAGGVAFDINLRYETVMANGGSNNFISLGLTKSFVFGKKD